jgi:prepilin-type processing-associated H-X9-DG protein
MQSTIEEIARDLPYPPLPKGRPDYGRISAEKRHGGTLNVLFCDDHVEALKFHPLFFDRSDAALRRWNKDNEPHRERLQ